MVKLNSQDLDKIAKQYLDRKRASEQRHKERMIGEGPQVNVPMQSGVLLEDVRPNEVRTILAICSDFHTKPIHLGLIHWFLPKPRNASEVWYRHIIDRIYKSIHRIASFHSIPSREYEIRSKEQRKFRNK